MTTTVNSNALTLTLTVVSNNDFIAKTIRQSILSALPSSGGDGAGTRGMKCSVIDILGHGPLESVNFPYHWVKVLHSNCARQ